MKEDNDDNHPLVSDSTVEPTCLTCGSRRLPSTLAHDGSFEVSFIDVMLNI